MADNSTPGSSRHQTIDMTQATKNDLEQGRRSYSDPNKGQTTFIEIILIILSSVFLIITFPLTIWSRLLIVSEYERLIVFRLGRLRGPSGILGPGINVLLPFIDNSYLIDMRMLSFSMAQQEILTKDSVTITLDAVVFFQVVDPTAAVTNVQDYLGATRMLAVSTLRTVLGTKKYSDILTDREVISHLMESSLREITSSWGIRVERVEIRDASLPVHMRRAMAAEAEAIQEARAKLINAEGEFKASAALKEAADVLALTPQAIQLRYLQTLNTIAAEKNSTIIFPLPIELLSGFTQFVANKKSPPVITRSDDHKE